MEKQVLPGYIFSKVMREVVKFWRSKGHKMVMYLDDGMGGASTLHEAELVSLEIQKDLDKLGFLVAADKSHWEPVQELVWLGFVWNTINNKIMVTSPRVNKLKVCIANILEGYDAGFVWFDVKSIASVVGQIISMQTVLGYDVRLRTRYLYFCILARSSWYSRVRLSAEAVSELRFWLTSVEEMNNNGTLLSQLTESDVSKVSVYCDASNTGFGGHLTICSEGEQVEFEWYGVWNEWESKQSSTWRELETVNRILSKSVDKVEGKSVEINSDNKNVQHILKVGSKKKKLQDIAMSVHRLCNEKDIQITGKWIPISENVRADSLSRMTDCDDWSVRQCVFDYFDNIWGPHTCDRFADRHNSKCENFNSKYWCAGSSAVDALSQMWTDHLNWVVPPPKLIPLVVRKLENDKCKCTLVIPEWKSAPFWPMLIDKEGNFKHYVKNFSKIQNIHAICRGRGNNGIFGKKDLLFNMIFLKIKF
ncbi:uncharacterized protein LOC134232701 [Saccostrea cucullata]|uniref:uncharacterized protein LOC134232701 n=1 Tax=Saccostrea cuccullata TaxID=36930 RepID=UPI002ED5C63D